MTSRERVRRAIDFARPDRIPLATGENADIRYVGFNSACDFLPAKPGMDEWGCVWTSLNKEAGDQGQVTEHPLSDPDCLDNYRFPDPYAHGRIDHAADSIQDIHLAGMAACANLGKGPMHLLDQLRGFENYLVDLMTSPDRIEQILDGIFAFLCGMVQQYGELGVDAFILWDDQAMQTGPLFSMDIWRERFKARYRKLFSLAHEYDCRFILHACGDLSQHLVDLADIEVDVIDNKQPSLWMNTPAVDAVRGKITFSTCVDIQTTIHSVEVEQIVHEVDRLVRRLSIPDGGFIATFYPKSDLMIDETKTRQMLEAFEAFSWK